MSRAIVVALIVASFCAVQGFYIPGINPVKYKEGDPVNIHVNGLHSLEAIVPYDYYYGPFCRPVELRSRHETIGEMLSGDRIRTSPYVVNMGYSEGCRVLNCQAEDKVVSLEKLRTLKKLIEQKYRGYMVIDNLPAFNNGSLPYQGRCLATSKSESYDYLRGYTLGVGKRCAGETLINNHLQFKIQYHRVAQNDLTTGATYNEAGYVMGETSKGKKNKKAESTEDEDYVVVGFTVEPFSIKWPDPQSDGTIAGCDDTFDPTDSKWLPLKLNDELKSFVWTYAVDWVEEPNIAWGSRWDSYLHTSLADTNDKVHWLSIINTLLIVFCLLSVIFVLLVRVLRKDLVRYNAIFELSKEEQEEAQKEDSGWKAVQGDVFRTPRHADLLIVLTTTGLQLLGMVVATLGFALIGFLSPANRGGLMSALLLVFVLQSFVGGYYTAFIRKKLGLEKSWASIFSFGIFLPTVMFTVFIICNLVMWHLKSSGAMPFVTLLTLVGLWICVSLPLAILGASFGYNSNPSAPVRPVRPTPRPIPAQFPWYLKTRIIVLFAGVLPLGSLFLELKFILASLWQGMVYYVFGFLMMVFVLWTFTVALTSVIAVYYRLCHENYHWWWVSFLAPGSLGLHVYLYMIYYFYTQLSITSSVATLIYFSYMGLVAFMYVLVAGCIGLLSSWLFVSTIYGSIKVD